MSCTDTTTPDSALSVERKDLKFALNPIDPATLNPALRRAVSEAVSATLSVVPFLADFLLAAPVVAVSRTGLPSWFIAATDGLRTYVEPHAFAALPVPQRVFVIAHETMHNVGRHAHLMHTARRTGRIAYKGKHLPYANKALNVALDAWINTVLVRSKIGIAVPNTVPPLDWSVDIAKVSPIDIYAQMLDRGGAKDIKDDAFDCIVDQPAGTAANSSALKGVRGVNLGGREVVRSAVEAGDEASETRHKERLAGAAARGRAAGTRAGDLFRALFDAGLKPVVRWQDVLRTELARSGEPQRLDWRVLDPPGLVRPYIRTLPAEHRRRMVLPAKTPAGMAPVFVAVDTSGSIDERTLARFLTEIIGVVNDCRPEALYIGWCDADLHRVDTVDDPDEAGVRLAARKGAVGGGGTSFVPPFLWLAGRAPSRCGATVPDNPPASVVYLTDAVGQFPTAEQVTASGISQLVWAVVGDAQVHAPGVVVRLNGAMDN